MMKDPPRTDEGFRPTPKQIIGAAIALVSLIFIFQNNEKGTLSFLWMDFTTTLWIWLLLMFVCGGVVGYMLAVRRSKRASKATAVDGRDAT
jgi:uncharacterized integral membrane protein